MLKQPYIKRLINARHIWHENHLKKKMDAVSERKALFQTDSGIPIKPLYTPLDVQGKDTDYLASLGFPGEFPFTRGIDPTMYRNEMYKIAQFTGFALPEETNKLYKHLLRQGMTSLYMALDLPCGLS